MSIVFATSRRIIPAYAGSTSRVMPEGLAAADHPRIRGEHCRAGRPGWPRAGSSPHTRGAPDAPGGREYSGWIIPAYAGSTPSPSISATPTPDHPRIRGEHVRRQKNDPAWHGSSPHTRGARSLSPRASQHRGIIPAYAGSTRVRASASPRDADHPRIRGEHALDEADTAVSAGSSPHTRGARRLVSAKARSRRIIPAYAGSTPPHPTAPSSTPDHPRIRGEHPT